MSIQPAHNAGSPSPSSIAPPRPVEWRVEHQPVSYPRAVAAMEARAAAIAAGEAPELVWLLEHPALYTAGTSARPEDLVEPDKLPVFETGRGGQHTYHGPGQRIAYLMLDLRNPRPGLPAQDLKAFVCTLEKWLITTVQHFGVEGERRNGRVGVWVPRSNGREDKIAAIGIRVRRWVTLHGISLNVAPDLANYAGIVPCGIKEHGVTSLAGLGFPASMAEVDRELRRSFERMLGPTADAVSVPLAGEQP